jgi:hypothetical protein
MITYFTLFCPLLKVCVTAAVLTVENRNERMENRVVDEPSSSADIAFSCPFTPHTDVSSAFTNNSGKSNNGISRPASSGGANLPSIRKKPSRSPNNLFSTASFSDYDYIVKRSQKSLDRRRKDSINSISSPNNFTVSISAPFDKPPERDLQYGSRNLEELSRILIDSGRFNEARLVCLDILHKEASSTIGVYHCLVKSCLALRLDEQAVWACRQFLSNHFSAMDSHCTYVNTLIATKRFEEGVRACNNALRLYPNNDILLNLRGECYFALKDYRKAVGDFHKTVEIARASCGRPATSHGTLRSWERCTNPFS